MIRILDRYVLRDVVVYFLLGVAGFVFFFLVFDAFERISVFVDNRTPARLILAYYLSSVAYNAVLVAPLSVLLSIFLGLGQLARFHELTAMKTAGLALHRIFMPVYFFGIVVSVLVFTVADRVMPGATRLRKKIYNEEIRGRLPPRLGILTNVNHLGSNGWIYAVRRFDMRRNQLQEVVVQKFDAGRLERSIDARVADWSGGHWVFREGVDRTFSDSLEVAAPFDSLVVENLVESPSDLAKQEEDSDLMSLAELSRYVARLRQSGRPTQKYATEKQVKLSYPLMNLMVVLLATPLAIRLRKGGIAVSFALSLALFVVNIGLFRLGQVLGHSGNLPPWGGAWLGDSLFALMGLVLYIKAPK